VDGLGNVIVTGPSGTNIPTPASVYATVKYDSAGNQLWAGSYSSGLGFDISRAVVADSQGNVIVTGSCGPNLNTTGFVTVKYSPDGVELWVRHYDGPGAGNDDPCGLAVDVEGNIYVTGVSYNADFSKDYATLKYSPAGLLLWEARYPTGYDALHDVPRQDIVQFRLLALAPWDNILMCGPYRHSDGNVDYLIIKYRQASSFSGVLLNLLLGD